MGVKLRDLVQPQTLHLTDLKGKRLALDAYNMLYQFLATIRQQDGQPFTDTQGRVTSHLVGLFYRTCSLLERGILPAYVFDGKPSDMKLGTLQARARVKEKAHAAWEEALAAGDLELARKKAAQTSRLTREMVEDARALLSALGVPCVMAPSEGEAQAAFMARQGDVWAAASEDYDTLLFGAPRLLRGLGAARGAARGEETEVSCLELEGTLQHLGISREELVTIGILVGTDFNEGVHGIGPKKALKLVLQHLGFEGTLRAAGLEPERVEPVRQLFEHPPTTSEYKLKWRAPDPKALNEVLVEGHGFSEERIRRTIGRIPAEGIGAPAQMSLEAFGGGAA